MKVHVRLNQYTINFRYCKICYSNLIISIMLLHTWYDYMITGTNVLLHAHM